MLRKCIYDPADYEMAEAVDEWQVHEDFEKLVTQAFHALHWQLTMLFDLDKGPMLALFLYCQCKQQHCLLA